MGRPYQPPHPFFQMVPAQGWDEKSEYPVQLGDNIPEVILSYALNMNGFPDSPGPGDGPKVRLRKSPISSKCGLR